MTTAVYLCDIEGQQTLFAFDGNITLTEIRNELERSVIENSASLENYVITTTRGDWFWNNLQQVMDEVFEWSQYSRD